MTHKISFEQWESYFLCENSFGVVDVHQHHLSRVAEILSERFPGILFFWDRPDRNQICSINAVRKDKRAVSRRQKVSIVAAGEAIASNVANKYPIKRGFLFWLLRRPVSAGWHYTEKP